MLNYTPAKLNDTLFSNLQNNTRDDTDALKKLSSRNTDVKTFLNEIKGADRESYVRSIATSLRDTALPSWGKTLAEHPGDFPQLMYLEFGDIVDGAVDTASYGIVGLLPTGNETPPLFEDPGFDYDFYHDIEADHGFDLYYFDLVDKYLNLDKYGDDLFDEETVIGAAYDITQPMVLRLNQLLAHKALKQLDEEGAMTAIGLPAGLPFSMNEHDGGGMLDIFYVKT